jgi:hypothetical protein
MAILISLEKVNTIYLNAKIRFIKLFVLDHVDK